MSEHHIKQSTSNAQEESSDVLSLVKKIQQHLVYLEKKIDMLVSQQSSGGGRPSFGGGGRPFNKRPFKPRFERSGHGGGDREQRDFGGGPRFDRGPRDRDRNSGGGERRGEGGGGFGGRNKKPWGRRER